MKRDDCRRCRHFVDDPARLEAALPGLTILSSAYGCARGDAGLCVQRGTWQDPVAACDAFVPRRPAGPPARRRGR